MTVILLVTAYAGESVKQTPHEPCSLDTVTKEMRAVTDDLRELKTQQAESRKIDDEILRLLKQVVNEPDTTDEPPPSPPATAQVDTADVFRPVGSTVHHTRPEPN